MIVQKMSVDPAVQTHKTQYELVLFNLENDVKWIQELSHGKRVGLYRIASDIGSGNFSHVKLAVHQLTRDKVAMKIIDKSKLDSKTRKMLAREIATMEAVHHPNIIRLFEVVETYSKIHLITEYAPGGELFNKITMEGRLEENVAKKLFRQILHGVKHMHDKGFIHRDIKAENVFYASPGIVKLGDFGFSTQLPSGMWQPLNTFCGSPPYAAPELFRDDSYFGRPVDAWALAVLLYFMLTAAVPFRAHTVAALKNFIIEGNYQIPGYVSDQCSHIIEHTLVQNPRQRMSVDEMLDSEWFQTPPPLPEIHRYRKNSLLFLANKFRRGSTTSNTTTGSNSNGDKTLQKSTRKCSTQLKIADFKDLKHKTNNFTKDHHIQDSTNEFINTISSKATDSDHLENARIRSKSRGQSLDVQMLPSIQPSASLKCADGTPVELGRFIMLPTCTHNLTFLNSLEVKTREKLQTYGITSQMLVDSIPYNSKSSLIGIYRVVMHRILTEEYIWDSLNNPMNLLTIKQKTDSMKESKRPAKLTLKKRIARTCVIV